MSHSLYVSRGQGRPTSSSEVRGNDCRTLDSHLEFNLRASSSCLWMDGAARYLSALLGTRGLSFIRRDGDNLGSVRGIWCRPFSILLHHLHAQRENYPPFCAPFRMRCHVEATSGEPTLTSTDGLTDRLMYDRLVTGF